MAVVDSLRTRFVIGAVVRLVRLAVLFRFIAGKKNSSCDSRSTRLSSCMPCYGAWRSLPPKTLSDHLGLLIEETRRSLHVMKKDCAVALWLFFLKKNKSFRFLLFFSYFAYSEHFLKSPSGTFSLPMAHIIPVLCTRFGKVSANNKWPGI